MRRFSRHLPPNPACKPLSWRGRVVLVGLGALFLAGLYHSLQFRMFALGVLGIVCVVIIRDRRRLKALKAVRPDTICAFRKAFDCRKVNPWIIRATYEEVRSHCPGFPVEATDDILNDVMLEGEDIEELCLDIASRSGYDLTSTESNPWYAKVKTVGDLVHFINHQPKIRLA